MKRKIESVSSRAGKRFKTKTTLSVSNAKKVNRMLRNIEKKHVIFETADSVAYFPQTAVTTLWGGIAEGDDFNQRTGRSVHIESLKFKVLFTGDTVAAPPAGIPALIGAVRMMWVWDKQPNGALALPGDIVSAATLGAISTYNPDNKKRFTVLYDKTIPLSFNNADSNQIQILQGTVKINKEIQYGLTTSVIAAHNTGALLLFGHFLAAGTLAGDPQVQISADVMFTDL